VGAAAVCPLAVLLDEAATGDRARGDFLDLQQQPEEIGPTTPEALLVVNQRHAPARPGYFSRNALMRTSYCWASREYTPYASAWISDRSAVCERTNAGVFDE
jgi:hypothetical protein